MSLWNIFVVTFILGLSGAISPGALLTYTISNSIKAQKKGWRIGLSISLGHATIELLLMLVLLFGLGTIINQPTILVIIGILGGFILSFFGFHLLLALKNSKIDVSFLQINQKNDYPKINPSNYNQTNKKNKIWNQNPFIGGILFLMSNPYWWLWWTTIGLSIMVDNEITLDHFNYIIVFIIAKELGAILWYTAVATAFGFSSKLLNVKTYLAILLFCGLFMVGYGLYLIVSSIIIFI